MYGHTNMGGFFEGYLNFYNQGFLSMIIMHDKAWLMVRKQITWQKTNEPTKNKWTRIPQNAHHNERTQMFRISINCSRNTMTNQATAPTLHMHRHEASQAHVHICPLPHNQNQVKSKGKYAPQMKCTRKTSKQHVQHTWHQNTLTIHTKSEPKSTTRYITHTHKKLDPRKIAKL